MDEYYDNPCIYSYKNLSKRKQIVNENKMTIITDKLTQMNHELSKILVSKRGQPFIEAN